jgi:hypothetical protein
LVFEAFELSPINGPVLATHGRLVRSFPGLAVAADASLFTQTDCAKMVASTLDIRECKTVVGWHIYLELYALEFSTYIDTKS